MKKNYFLFLLMLSLSLSNWLASEILEAPHFKKICEFADHDTLLLLDIDDTLLIPVQMLGCDECFLYYMQKRIATGLTYESALDITLKEFEAIRHITKMELVEEGTDNIIREIQDSGCKIMGLTTQGSSLSTRTHQQLKSNFIDLSLTSPISHDFFLSNEGHGVLFRRGILFTSGTQKGIALFTLLDKHDLHPKRIVFINDKEKHLKEVEKIAEQRNIEFIGLRYAFSDKRKARFNPEIAEIQLQNSTFTHILSDIEAEALLIK